MLPQCASLSARICRRIGPRWNPARRPASTSTMRVAGMQGISSRQGLGSSFRGHRFGAARPWKATPGMPCCTPIPRRGTALRAYSRLLHCVHAAAFPAASHRHPADTLSPASIGRGGRRLGVARERWHLALVSACAGWRARRAATCNDRPAGDCPPFSACRRAQRREAARRVQGLPRARADHRREGTRRPDRLPEPGHRSGEVAWPDHG